MKEIFVSDFDEHTNRWWVNYVQDSYGNGGSGLCAKYRSYRINSDLSSFLDPVTQIDQTTGALTYKVSDPTGILDNSS